jgi:type IV pilus assembly protein PilX
MRKSMITASLRDNQSGAALIISLVLLVVVTVLAVSGMNTATTELAMARNDKSYENAFQAAESGLEIALARGQFSTQVAAVMAQEITEFDSVTAVIDFSGITQVPDRAFSLGIGGGISAYHFVVTSTASSKPGGVGGATTDRDATATHTQAFYVVGPGAPAF